MTSTERILEFIEYKGISKREFYAATGLSNGSLDKSANVGSDKLEKIISAYPELNLYYLINMSEVMLKEAPAINGASDENGPSYRIYPPGEGPVVADNRIVYSINPQGQNGGQRNKNVTPTVSPTKLLTPQIISVDPHGNENILYVPLRASAGYLKGMGDITYMEKLPSFSLPGLEQKTYRAFQVDGDSMYPTLEDKEMVIGEWMEKLDFIREDRVHIIVTKNDGILVKRLLNRINKYGCIIAKSDSVNDRNLYPNIEIHPEDVLELWYAVWHGGFNFKAPGDLWRRQNNLEADLTDVLRRLKQAGL